MRGRWIGTLAVVVLLVTSGCLGAVLGDLTFEASPASVSADALEATGYEERTRDTWNLSKNYTVDDERNTITVVNHVAVYERAWSGDSPAGLDAGLFAVVTTPAAEFGGEPLNPVADVSERQVIERLDDRTANVENVSHVENRTVSVLGAERTVGKYAATTTTDEGVRVDVFVHVTRFRHGGDVVVAVGVHARQNADEQARIDELLRGLEHRTTGHADRGGDDGANASVDHRPHVNQMTEVSR